MTKRSPFSYFKTSPDVIRQERSAEAFLRRALAAIRGEYLVIQRLSVAWSICTPRSSRIEVQHRVANVGEDCEKGNFLQKLGALE